MSNRIAITPSEDKLPIGLSLKSQHFSDVLDKKPAVTFFEVHAENFMSAGGAHHRYLEKICDTYALSVHGVGMSLGSAEGIDKVHLDRFKAVVERYSPALVSEHLAWSHEGGFYLNDLLPLPLNSESLAVVAANIDTMQNHLGRKILIENPSAYMAFEATDISEPEFLTRLVETTGCGILLDVNNVFVSGSNMGWNIESYLRDIPSGSVEEIHLAGHTLKKLEAQQEIRIDDHGSEVNEDVWRIYSRLLNEVGSCPTLIEWDTNVPAFDVLLAEAEKACDIFKSWRNGVNNHIQLGRYA